MTLTGWKQGVELISQAVETAFVPIMKTVISGVEVDLLFGRINQTEAGDKLDIEKDEILRGVDDASQRSLNGAYFYIQDIFGVNLHGLGPRVTDMILNLVPDVTTFRTTLRAIRLWAKRTSRSRRALLIVQAEGSTRTYLVSLVVWPGHS